MPAKTSASQAWGSTSLSLAVMMRVLAAAVARGIVEGGRWCPAGERSVVPNIGPDASGRRLALGQNGDCPIVAMQPFRRQDMGLDQTVERQRGKHAGTDLVGQRRDSEIDALALEALALAAQRNVLGELVDQASIFKPASAARLSSSQESRWGRRSTQSCTGCDAHPPS